MKRKGVRIIQITLKYIISIDVQVANTHSNEYIIDSTGLPIPLEVTSISGGNDS